MVRRLPVLALVAACLVAGPIAAAQARRAPSPFPAAVAAAMKVAAASARGVALVAPTDLEVGIAPSRTWHLGALVTAKAGSYDVAYEWTYVALPVNSPRLYQGKYANLTALGIVGGFGGRTYPTVAKAEAALAAVAPVPSLPAGSASKHVAKTLAPGVRAQVWVHAGTVLWHQGEATVLLTSPGLTPDLATSRQVARWLTSLPLPRAPLALDVDEGGDGQHTTVAWRVGRTVYTAWNYHAAVLALRMAARMRPWR